MFVKHQVQEINGKEYEYWYLYESYYEPGMEYPQNFKVGKVGDSVSSLVDSLKDKADSKGIDLDPEDVEHFRLQVETVESKAEEEGVDTEDEEELGKFFERMFSSSADEDDDENVTVTVDPEDVGDWSLQTSSYGEEDGKWVWSDKEVYVIFNESNNSLYVERGRQSPSEKVKELDSWEDAVEWLRNNSAEELGRELSSKDPRELNYVYRSLNRPVPSSFKNSIPEEALKSEISVEGRLVGSSDPLPYSIFEEYELSLDEKNIDNTLSLSQFVSKTGLEKDVLVREFEAGNYGEIKQAIKNELYKYDLDHRYLTGNVFESLKDEVESLDEYGEDVDSISVKLKGTDEIKISDPEIRENGIVPSRKLPEEVSRTEFERNVYDSSFGGFRNTKDYVMLDSGESIDIGEVYVKGGRIVGSDIDRSIGEDAVPEVEDMEVHEVVENMRVRGSDKELKEDFARKVLNLVNKYNLGSDNDGRRVWKHLVVESGKKDAYASVKTVSNNIVGIQLNVDRYKNAPEAKKKEIEVHEAVHFYRSNHLSNFYNKLIEVIGEEYGSLDGFRRFIATDIRASTDRVEPEKIIPDFSEEVFDWEIKDFAEKYSKMIRYVQDYSESDKFSEFSGNMSYEEVGSKVVLRVGRGRGRKRLEVAEIDRITGKVSVKSPEYWVYLDKVDMTDGSLEFEQMSKRFSDAMSDMKYGNKNLGDIRDFNRYSKGDRYDPLVLKVRDSLKDYMKGIDESTTFDIADENKVVQVLSDEMVNVLKVDGGDIVVMDGIYAEGNIPVIVDEDDGDFQKELVDGRMGIKKFIGMLEEGVELYKEGKLKNAKWNEYSSEDPGDIDIIGIREDEKDKYYRMINSIKARVPQDKWSELEDIKFTSNLKSGGRGLGTIGLYSNGSIKIDKSKDVETQYYVIAHEIGHLVEGSKGMGGQRLMGQKYQKTGVSYILKPEDREVLDNFRENIREEDLSDLPQHGQNELTWLYNQKFGKREQSQDNYNYKEVFARAFSVWIVNQSKFEDKFPDMAEYLEDFVENRGTFEEEYGEQ